MTGTAGASGAGADSYSQTVTVALHGMPHGTVNFYRGPRALDARVVLSGLTPGSSHAVDLLTGPKGPGVISFGTITANSDGDANAYRASGYTGQWHRGSRFVIRMGAEKNPVAYRLIAETAELQAPGVVAHRLYAVDLSRVVNYRPKGRATISYSSAEHTLTVTVRAGGLTPGPHAANIRLGTCEAQGPVLYMLADLVADSRGKVVDAVRVIKNVTKPIPANGWYLNIHQGNSADILSKGKPTIYFRPLLCGNIHAK